MGCTDSRGALDMGCTDSREKDDLFEDSEAPSPIVPRRIKDKASASTSGAHLLSSALTRSSKDLCDLKVTREQGGVRSTDVDGLIESIIGEYDEAGMHNDKKCYKNRNGWIHLYWHDGSFGRMGWWFGEEVDGYSGLAWNCALGAGRNDSKEVPETGWLKPDTSFFESPQKVRIKVAPPPPPITEPPAGAFSFTRNDNGGSTMSCFSCWDEIRTKLSGGGPRRPAAPWAQKGGEGSPKTPQAVGAEPFHASVKAKITRTYTDSSLAIQEHASRVQERVQEHASTVKANAALALQERAERVRAKTAEIHGKALGLHGKALEQYRDAVPTAHAHYQRLRSQSQEAFDKHYPLVKSTTMDLYEEAKGSNLAHAALACCDCIPAAGPTIDTDAYQRRQDEIADQRQSKLAAAAASKSAAVMSAAASQSSKADWRAQGANDWNLKVAEQAKEIEFQNALDQAAEADDAHAADTSPVAAKVAESARSTAEADQAAGVSARIEASRSATRAEAQRLSQLVAEHRQEVEAEQAVAEQERLIKRAAVEAAFEAAAEAEEAKRQKLMKQMADRTFWANQERIAREQAAERVAAAAAREANEAAQRAEMERLAQEAARRYSEENLAREATDDAARELAEAKLMEEEFLAREAAEASEAARTQESPLKKINIASEPFLSPRQEAKNRQLENLSPMDKSEFQRRKEVFNSPRQ